MSASGLGEEEKRLIGEFQQLAKQGQGWSEYDTCDAIILRALREIGGYWYGDYRAQQSTTAGYPDFTILPDTEYTWYLEAKALRVDLNNDHVVQVLNYANATGRRWVVLSNGREWRLYDQHIPGLPVDKLVATATLENPQEIAEFLHAIGKQSMQTGQIDVYARRQRLKRVLDEQLGDPRSEVIRAIVSKLRSLGLNGASGEDVVAYFEGKPVKIEVASVRTGSGGQPPDADGYRLDELARRAEELATGKKPLSVTFPDGTAREVDEWKKLVMAVIEWFGERLPPPPQPRKAGSKRYLYNEKPEHQRNPMRSPAIFRVAGKDLFVDMWVSAREHLSALVYLCECIGEPPSGFRIRLRE